MPQLSKINIRGFRRLRDVSIDMRSLMVMIGGNGVGKTSMLDALSLLSASASGTMNKTLSDLGGIADVATSGYPEGIGFEAAMDIPGQCPLEYRLHLEVKGYTYQIAEEGLVQERGRKEPFKYLEAFIDNICYFPANNEKLVRPDWKYNNLESALSQIPKMFREPEAFRNVLGSATKYHVLDVAKNSPIRLPQQMRPSGLPGSNGEELISFLYTLKETDPDRYEQIEDTLRAAFPRFEMLKFPPAAAGMLSLTWKETSFRNPVYIHQLSEGTLRFLWLISLLQSPVLPTITLIDEPEVSLHPELLSLLADLLREASKRTRIVVATHSDRLIRFLKPEEVLVLDGDEEGHTQVTWGDALDLKEWLQDVMTPRSGILDH
ncbi:MAG: AAA family ATPase [Magnetococcales bacterium]|nr:AAA family ATPase [Magnetococcales bacterium]